MKDNKILAFHEKSPGYKDGISLIWNDYFSLRHGEGYVFIVVRCLGLSVCLPVSNIMGKRLCRFSWHFQGKWDLIQGTIGNIFRIFHLTPWTQDFFPTFSEESMALSSITEKRLNGFSWNFQKRTDLTQGALWNIFGMLRLTPWILGRFIYFLDQCLFVILWKNGWRDFHEFLLNVRHDTRNNELDCFIPP